MTKIYKAIGLMSGTSMDGVDLALIESDGQEIINTKLSDYVAYDKSFKDKLKSVIYDNPTLLEIKLIEKNLTQIHGDFVNQFLQKNNIKPSEIDLISFHGHTILHQPQQNITWQIGDKFLLEKITNIKVIHDFRSKDVIYGGQGAPLVPIYHYNLFKANKAKVIINIGGIANLSYFNDSGLDSLEAFDYCFGNAPMDDIVRNINLECDIDGKLAAKGEIKYDLANEILKHDIFHIKPPKSFDRDDFANVISALNELNINDYLATLCFIHCQVLAINLSYFKEKAEEVIICGGGRKNKFLIDLFKRELTDFKILIAEDVGFNGDTIEGEAFAYLGIRKLLNLAISFKKTTGSSINYVTKS